MLDVAKSAIPFDTKQLDRLMDEAGIDVLITNSKHNIQYLSGGYRSSDYTCHKSDHCYALWWLSMRYDCD